MIGSSKMETPILYINSIFGAQGWSGQDDKELKDGNCKFIWSSRVGRTICYGAEGWRGHIDKELKDGEDKLIRSSRMERTS